MDPKTLKPGVSPKEVWSWAAFDFANSGYTTVVLTAVFNAYFVSVVAGGEAWATFLWTCVIAASNALGLFAMPVIAAIADRYGLVRTGGSDYHGDEDKPFEYRPSPSTLRALGVR